ncbi:unnamed protein product [Soboliphyme baturini]|uniref:EF-hand domain-containing protein n=1 Tax=Soboliphyme baturini TaxID=241478 RepID=A0A183IEB9_9BILA|nr:unnamed protein product [Soboliphyme baturini]
MSSTLQSFFDTLEKALGQDKMTGTEEEVLEQLYELSDEAKRKEFLDDLFSFMQKRAFLFACRRCLNVEQPGVIGDNCLLNTSVVQMWRAWPTRRGHRIVCVTCRVNRVNRESATTTKPFRRL